MTERERHGWAEILQQLQKDQPVKLEKVDIEIPAGSSFRHGTIAKEITFKECTVRGRLSFNNVSFNESVSFVDTKFENGLDLKGCAIQGQLAIQDVLCAEHADFEALAVQGHTLFSNVEFLTSSNFVTASFGRHTSFRKASFKKGVQFANASFGGTLIIDNDCHFSGPCDLSAASLNGTLNISDSCFDDLLTLTWIQIGGRLLIKNNRLEKMDMSAAKIGAGISISNCGYEQPVVMRNIQTDGSVEIRECHFMKDSVLDLEGAKIGGNVQIFNCSLDHDNPNERCLKLSSVQVGGSCSIQSVICLGGVSAWNARVGSILRIGATPGKQDKYESYFHGDFTLFGMKVDGSLLVTGLYVENEADLTGNTVTGDTYINSCTFKQGAHFNRSRFTGVFGTASQYGKTLRCTNSHFHQAVRLIYGCVLQEGIDLSFSHFEKEANFGGAKITEKLDLRQCRFNHSLLFDLNIPQDAKDKSAIPFSDEERPVIIFLDGCVYGAFVPPHGRWDTTSVQRFVEHISTAEPASLLYLEQWLRGAARIEQADMVRYHRYNQAGNSLPRRSLDWWSNRFYRHTTRYGTKFLPLIVVIVLLAVAALGAKLFGMHFAAQKEWLDTAGVVFATVASACLTLVVSPLLRRVWPQ